MTAPEPDFCDDDDGDYEGLCTHDCDDLCEDEWDGHDCGHQHCWNCGECGCPGYCDDVQTYNLRPAETGGSASYPAAAGA